MITSSQHTTRPLNVQVSESNVQTVLGSVDQKVQQQVQQILVAEKPKQEEVKLAKEISLLDVRIDLETLNILASLLLQKSNEEEEYDLFTNYKEVRKKIVIVPSSPLALFLKSFVIKKMQHFNESIPAENDRFLAHSFSVIDGFLLLYQNPQIFNEQEREQFEFLLTKNIHRCPVPIELIDYFKKDITSKWASLNLATSLMIRQSGKWFSKEDIRISVGTAVSICKKLIVSEDLYVQKTAYFLLAQSSTNQQKIEKSLAFASSHNIDALAMQAICDYKLGSFDMALDKLKKAAEYGSKCAKYFIFSLVLKGAFKNKQVKLLNFILQFLRDAAACGHPEAQHTYANYLFFNERIKQNTLKQVGLPNTCEPLHRVIKKLYQRAAAYSPIAMLHLSFYYEIIGGDKDKTQNYLQKVVRLGSINIDMHREKFFKFLSLAELQLAFIYQQQAVAKLRLKKLGISYDD